MKISDQLESLIRQANGNGICNELLAVCPKTDNPTADKGNDCTNCLFNKANEEKFQDKIEMLRIMGD